MKIIKKLNILSVAKISGILYGGIYLVAGLVINVVVLIFGIPSLKNFDILGFGSGILATFLVALFIGAVSFVIGMIFAWLYNVAANIVGGISWEESSSFASTSAKTSVDKKASEDKKKKRAKEEETAMPQDEVNNILDKPKKDLSSEARRAKEEEEDTFSSDNSNFLSS